MRRRSAAQALVWLTLALPLFVSIAGLAIDGGVLLASRRQLQSVADGAARVRGAPDRQVALGALAEFAGAPYPGRSHPAGVPVGLEATEYFAPTAATYSNGAHAAVVEVDAATGAVTVLRYAMVHDSGNVINPLVIEGQLLGGLVAGLGNALLEEVIYDDRLPERPG